MQYLTRICFNTDNWQRPTGDAAKLEHDSFAQQYGYGHEEWLFRYDWLVSGWQYGFIQGIQDSRARLARTEEMVFDLILFTIDDQGRRKLVGKIRDAELLTEGQCQDALDIYQKQGWLQRMAAEVEGLPGEEKLRLQDQDATWIFNIRFRHENYEAFPPETYADSTAVQRFTRYMLYRLPDASTIVPAKSIGVVKQKQMPNQANFERSAVPGKECTREHGQIQTKLIEQLQAKHPGCVDWETNNVDVTLTLPGGVTLYEVKSDRVPRTVLRLALGQLLEYAFYHQGIEYPNVRLVAVGPSPLDAKDERYLEHLQDLLEIPLDYLHVSL